MILIIHILSMKMSWFYDVSGASEVWSWLLLIFDWLGWRRKKWWLAEAFLAFYHINFSFMSLEKWWDFSLWRKDSSPGGHRIHPLVDTCPFSNLIRQVVAWWEGAPAVSIVAGIWLTSSSVLHLLRFVCGLTWPCWALQISLLRLG